MMNNHPFSDDRQRLEVLLMEVTCQNNEGVDYLTQQPSSGTGTCTDHRFKCAVLCFTRSISLLNEAMSMNMDSASLDIQQRLPEMFSCTNASELQDDSPLYVQRRLTTFDPMVFNTRSGTNIVSMLLLYNLGIACHSVGLQSQDEEMVNKAEAFYDICAGAVVDRDWGIMYNLAWACSMGARNNRAVLAHQYFGNRGMATKLFEDLCSDIHEFCVTNDDVGPSILSAADTSEIFLNFVILKSPLVFSAAKAA